VKNGNVAYIFSGLGLSGEIVVLDEPGNLLPEYDSSDEEMEVEVKVDRPGEKVEMAT
jgi:hypothetical protein